MVRVRGQDSQNFIRLMNNIYVTSGLEISGFLTLKVLLVFDENILKD